MSAFLTSHENLALITNLCIEHLDKFNYGEEVSPIHDISRILLIENLKSLEHRYQTNKGLTGQLNEWVRDTSFNEMMDMIEVEAKKGSGESKEKLIDVLDSYDYQCCEHPGWKKSTAFKIVTTLKDISS